MSGGHFDYVQHYIESIVCSIEDLVSDNDYADGRNFSKETIEKFNEAHYILEKAYVMAKRIDWLVSSDDSEETFHERWNKELELVDKLHGKVKNEARN